MAANTREQVVLVDRASDFALVYEDGILVRSGSLAFVGDVVSEGREVDLSLALKFNPFPHRLCDADRFLFTEDAA